MARIRGSALLVVVAASQLGAGECGGPVLRDTGFDLWCGDHLCVWTVVRGDTRRVGTWHDDDAGVELLGDDAAIQQVSPVSSLNTSCVKFELLADVDPTVEAFLEIDMYADGTVERMERLPTSGWEPVSYSLALKAPFDGVRFVLSKRGIGKAVLAQIKADRESPASCAGLTEIDGGPAPDGGHCTFDGDCTSGICSGSGMPSAGLCVGCSDAGAPCPTGEVCGRDEPLGPLLAVPTACAPEGGDGLAELCRRDDECASGLCNIPGLCSSCVADSQCLPGESCREAWDRGPLVCAPGGRARLAGQPCATHGDCASGTCAGKQRGECGEHPGLVLQIARRPCATAADCPLDENFQPYACTMVGIQGGTCQ